MVQIPGLEMFIINRQVADIEAAPSRQRLASEARRWHAERVARGASRPVERTSLAARLAARWAGLAHA